MTRPTKSVSQMTRKISKAEKQAREEMERKLVRNLQSKPEAWLSMNKKELEVFNKLTKLNENFTEADSISLSMLASSLYNYEELSAAARELDIYDEARGSLERRTLAYDKAVQQHMAALSIPLSQRLRLSNEMAKLMIEEKKLANMEAQNTQTINPLLALLEDDDYE
ncbi:hypothetical protein [Bacillus paramycoides]|uniref:Terminase n=1 Tax=Bacillus paramycoides TaxID=2026194 RepID=A0ABU6MU31_9BACI|nr:hypothetical protein [Bacillus paramycoides]